MLLQLADPRLGRVRGGLRGQERGGLRRRARRQLQEERRDSRRDFVRFGNGTDHARRGRVPVDERRREATRVPAVLLMAVLSEPRKIDTNGPKNGICIQTS